MARAGKTERGRATRRRIVAAADKLFKGQGYLETTMAAIAAEAGVAVQTLYLAFGSKAAILWAAHDVAVVGDDEPVPLLERPWVAEVRAEPDGLRALQLVMENTLDVIERTSPITDVMNSGAADPEVAPLVQRRNALRYQTLLTLTEELSAKHDFPHGYAVDKAADVLYTVISPELYRLLVVERGWPREEWHRWAYESVALRLFPGLTQNDGGSKDGARPTRKRR